MAIENWPETGRIPVYLVGGAVRDRLLGRTPREYDFAFDADEATFLQRNPEARKVGKSVSVFLLRGQEFMPLEGTLEEDMRRRDLTINALAEDRDGNLLGHPHALSDLREGILRPASPPQLPRCTTHYGRPGKSTHRPSGKKKFKALNPPINLYVDLGKQKASEIAPARFKP